MPYEGNWELRGTTFRCKKEPTWWGTGKCTTPTCVQMVCKHLTDSSLRTRDPAWCRWLTPVILATQEAEIRRITVRSHPGQIVHKTLSRKNPITQNWAGGMAQGKGPVFKPQYHKKKKRRKKNKRPHLDQTYCLKVAKDTLWSGCILVYGVQAIVWREATTYYILPKRAFRKFA
jgi:hypothetical protein